MILSPGQSFNACARCCEEQSWHQPVGACPAWVTQPNSALFPLFLPDLHSSPQAPLLSLACSKLISYYCGVFFGACPDGTCSFRLAGEAHDPFTMPFSFPIISHLLSQVCKMLEMGVDLHVKKTKNKWKTIQLALSLI